MDPIPTSTRPATCGRQVHLYSNAWEGPRPATVLRPSAPGRIGGESPEVARIDCNVALHGVDDAGALNQARARAHGNTCTDVPLYDALSDEQRAGVLEQAPALNHSPASSPWFCWAEWPPLGTFALTPPTA